MKRKIIVYFIITFIFYWLFQSSINPYYLVLGLILALFIYENLISNTKKEDNDTDHSIKPLFYKSPTMIVEVDTNNWLIKKINDVLSNTLNTEHPYQVIGQPLFSLFAKDEEKKLQKALHSLKRRSVLHQYLSEMMTRDGHKINVTLDGVLLTDNKETNLAYLYITNVSSIKKIETKLEANRHLLQNIIDNTLEAVIITNKTGKIIEWNPQAAMLIGQGKNNVINKPISQVVIGSEESKLFLEKDINNFLLKQPTKYIGKREIFTIINKLNKKLTVASCCFPVLSDDDSYVFCFFLHDITDLKRKELKIQELMNDLEDSNKELQSFAYIASHDLKEPLMGIKNYAEIITDDYATKLDEQGLGYLNSLKNSCNRMQLLLESLLQYSRVGHLQFSLQPVDVNHIVHEVQESIHHVLKQKNASIIIDGPLPHVMADISRLNEVFTNLITNGLKYNDNSCPIINIGSAPEKSTNGLNCLYVKDNGIGIESSKIDTVFQIFQRLHKQGEYGGGSGAGLTITKRIIERHKGSIWLESVPGMGTTFYFTLGQSETPKNNTVH